MSSGLTPGMRYTIEEALEEAAAARAQSRLNDAEQLCRAVLAGEPGHPAANYEIALLGMILDRPADALGHMQVAVDGAPDREPYWQGLAEVAARADQLDVLRAAILKHGAAIQSLPTRRFVAVLALGLGIAQALSFSGSPTRAETDAVIALIDAGRLDASRAAAEALTLRFPLDGFGWKALGTALVLGRRGAEACAPLEIAAILRPDDAESHNTHGAALRAAGRLDDAEVSLLRALRLHADFAEAHNNLGLVRLDRGDPIAAEACFRASLAVNPDYAEAHNNLGRALQATGQVADAERAYRRAIALAPADADAHNNLGTVLRALGEPREALRSVEHALRLRPDNVRALNNRALIAREAGDVELARRSAGRALALDPGFAEAHVNLAAIHEDLGELEAAREALAQALALKPDFAAAHANLGKVLCDLDAAAGATAACRRALDLDPAGHGLEAGVYLAVLLYLADDPNGCRDALARTRAVIEGTAARQANVRRYWQYLDRLVALRAMRPLGVGVGLPQLVAVGESHALGLHGLVVAPHGVAHACRTEWIWGCKQWHLGGAGPNRFRRRFDAVFDRLPEQTAVLMCVGEIDCRPDEGISAALARDPSRDLAQIVRATVEGYVAHVEARAARRNLRPIYSGVPSPYQDDGRTTAEARARQVETVRAVNAVLAEQAAAHGRDFLDVGAMTDGGDGRATGHRHLDRTHLHPDSYVAAFEGFLRQR